VDRLNLRRGTDNATPPNGFRSGALSSSLNEVSPTSRQSNERSQSWQKPFSLPSRSTSFSRWGDNNFAAGSPVEYSTSFRSGYRSPIEEEGDRSPPPSLRSNAGGYWGHGGEPQSFSGRSNLDNDTAFEQDDFVVEETSGIGRLRINDGNNLRPDTVSPMSGAGQKRRASSPPREDESHVLRSVPSANGLFTRRESSSRASPTPRLHSNHGSVSSIASISRTGSSYPSILAPSGGSSISSYSRCSQGGLSSGCLSPGGISPGGISPRSANSENELPLTASRSVTASPRASVSGQAGLAESRPALATRKPSDTRVNHIKRLTTDKLHGVFMCECCPKKPKKFETEEELK
jgi:hypothetical protein